MLSLGGSCISLKVSLRIIKNVFLFFRGIIEYREYNYMSFLGDLNRTSISSNGSSEGRINDSSNSWAMTVFSHPLDDYSDAEEELEVNLDTD